LQIAIRRSARIVARLKNRPMGARMRVVSLLCAAAYRQDSSASPYDAISAWIS
jgi:hypothetical protein